MKRLLAAQAAPAAAKTLCFASQGDLLTAGPHAQNESFTTPSAQSVHDTLVMRDDSLKLSRRLRGHAGLPEQPLHQRRGDLRRGGRRSFDYGRCVNPRLDEVIDAASAEMNASKRRELIRRALAGRDLQVHHVPLHRQMIPWAMRSNVKVVHRAHNSLNFESVRID